MNEKDEFTLNDPEDKIAQWKKGGAGEKDQHQQDDNPIGELDLDALDTISGGRGPLTVGGGCSHSYDDRPSCGHFCTLTAECGCSSQ